MIMMRRLRQGMCRVRGVSREDNMSIGITGCAWLIAEDESCAVNSHRKEIFKNRG